jgi:mono/diheme cytochrome c family protein
MIKRQNGITVGVVGLALVLSALVVTASGKNEVKPSDTAAYYNAKCVACHGKKAEKKFNATLTDEQMVEIVLKGKKGEKPPNMPAYEAKGVTADQAKAFVAHMKQLHATP